MGTFLEHAKKEMELAGLYYKNSKYEKLIGKSIMELVEVFDKQEHDSRQTVSMIMKIFEKLTKFEPLTPLLGTPEEWNRINDISFQNKRYCYVFAEDENGKNAYDLHGKVFIDPEGISYTTNESAISIEFPYMPKNMKEK